MTAWQARLHVQVFWHFPTSYAPLHLKYLYTSSSSRLSLRKHIDSSVWEQVNIAAFMWARRESFFPMLNIFYLLYTVAFKKNKKIYLSLRKPKHSDLWKHVNWGRCLVFPLISCAVLTQTVPLVEEAIVDFMGKIVALILYFSRHNHVRSLTV